MWEIISKEEVSQFIRVPVLEISDLWYDLVISLIEDYTGWYSLDYAEDIIEDIDGDGSAFLRTQIPINSVSTILLNGVGVPSSYYSTKWHGVTLKTYISDTSIIDHEMFYNMYEFGFYFPIGLSNINVSYNAGGISSLPARYRNKIRTALLLCIKELSIIPRNEGSDQMMREYVPRKQTNRGEVLKRFGVHGKIMGIIESILPPKSRFA